MSKPRANLQKEPPGATALYYVLPHRTLHEVYRAYANAMACEQPRNNPQ